jgi:hypothetical protein
MMRKQLEIGQLEYYGQLREIFGPYSYMPAQYLTQNGLAVVQWPGDHEPDEKIAHQVCKLLNVKKVLLAAKDHKVFRFDFVESSAQLVI